MSLFGVKEMLHLMLYKSTHCSIQTDEVKAVVIYDSVLHHGRAKM